MVRFGITVPVWSADFDLNHIFPEFFRVSFQFLIITLLSAFPVSSSGYEFRFIHMAEKNITASRLSGVYSVFVSIFSPVYARVLFMSVSSSVIFANRRYLDFSVAFFYTQVYLFAFASNFEPSMYRCCRSTPSARSM